MNMYPYQHFTPVNMVDPWGLYEFEDWKLTPVHIAEILLYTMQYYGAKEIGDKYTAHEASNNAQYLRDNDLKTNEHFTLKRITNLIVESGADSSNWGIFLLELGNVQDRLGGISSDGLSQSLESIAGKNLGEIASVFVSGLTGGPTPEEEYANYIDTLDEFSLRQQNEGGFIDINTVTYVNEYGIPSGYVSVVYDNQYEGAYIERRFFETSFELTLISNLPV